MVHSVCLVSVSEWSVAKIWTSLDKLFRSLLTFWMTARGKFDSHWNGKSEIHKFSFMAMQNFLAAMRRQTTPTDQQLNRSMQAQIDEN